MMGLPCWRWGHPFKGHLGSCQMGPRAAKGPFFLALGAG